MTAAESRVFGRKSRGSGGNPAFVLARLLSALARIFLPLIAPKGPALRKLLLVAVAVSLALAPLPAAVATHAPDSAAQAALAEQEAAEHGHSHDDEDDAGHSASHKHGHDPADHSHQYAFLTGSGSHWGLPPSQRWPSAMSGRLDGAIGLGIERPPKQALSI
jgi:hypothetical protein